MLTKKSRNAWIDACYQHWTPSAAKLYRIANTGVEQSANDCLVTDHRGTEYLDCACSYGIFLIGHGNPVVRAAAAAQLGTLAAVPAGTVSTEQIRLTEKLREIVPGEWGQVRYTMTGAEAIEQVLRYVLATRAPKNRIVVMQQSYHGKTLATMNILGQQHASNELGLNRQDVVFIPYGDFQALESAITTDTAAVFIEPILGGAYLRLPPAGYLKRIRERCSAAGALLVADEIQTAFGRCGKWFAIEYEDVVPDIIVLSKGLTGGYAAIGAILYGAHLSHHSAMDTTSQGGQPYACSVALAAIEVLTSQRLIEKSKAAANALGTGLQRLANKYPTVIKDAPAIGLMTGIRLNGAVYEALICTALGRKGIHAGHSMNEKAKQPVLRFYPPLTITLAQVEHVLTELEQVLDSVSSQPRWKLKLLSGVISNLYKLPYAILPKGSKDV
ncbi:aspartate aminotransferase family protein [Pseudomonas fluorescens]|uniref:aspartate aminotransferase family protein n=1 Tax=Pseudomonas fluorescens TaxID=294 RepID=UPI00178409EE|nr:aminotransferase class III-fold pyridoxal phosphate-dependent enzyme [Pseudomonas fluorescens]